MESYLFNYPKFYSVFRCFINHHHLTSLFPTFFGDVRVSSQSNRIQYITILHGVTVTPYLTSTTQLLGNTITPGKTGGDFRTSVNDLCMKPGPTTLICFPNFEIRSTLTSHLFHNSRTKIESLILKVVCFIM